MRSVNLGQYAIPIAIVAAGALIAGALVTNGRYRVVQQLPGKGDSAIFVTDTWTGTTMRWAILISTPYVTYCARIYPEIDTTPTRQ